MEASKGANEPRVRENLILKAVNACPDHPEAYHFLAKHYQALHMRVLARDAYRQALERNPSTVNMLRDIGRLNPRSPKDALWNVIGLVLPPEEWGQSAPPESTSIQGLMQKQPESPEARLALAQELTSIGAEKMRSDNREGTDLAIRALELVPSYEPARSLLVRYYARLGDYHLNSDWFDNAVSYYQKALEFAPNDPRLHLKIAETYSRTKGRGKEALQHFQKADGLFAQRAIVIGPEEEAAFRQRIQRGLDHFDENRPAYRMARSAKAQQRGKMSLGKGEYSKAVDAFREALRWTPGDALLHFDLAMALKQVNGKLSTQEAIQHFERSLALFRTNPPPDVANLSEKFIDRAQMEIAHLKGTTNSFFYLFQHLSIGIQERAIELALFVIVFAGIAAYLLRAGLRLTDGEPADPYSSR